MLQKCSLWSVAHCFFKEPATPHYVAELSRATGLAHTSITLHLKTLEEQDIIYRYEEQKNTRQFPYYKAKRESEQYRTYKRIYNYSVLFESGLVEELKKLFAPDAIVVFGSHERGEDTETSDIDIFVKAEAEHVDLNRYEEKLGRKIELHVKESLQKYPKTLRENIMNGCVLEGRMF
ncbi:MAG: nucleotidyltransferase domain-containing protein [Nanobdellota archaeon]